MEGRGPLGIRDRGPTPSALSVPSQISRVSPPPGVGRQELFTQCPELLSRDGYIQAVSRVRGGECLLSLCGPFSVSLLKDCLNPLTNRIFPESSTGNKIEKQSTKPRYIHMFAGEN